MGSSLRNPQGDPSSCPARLPCPRPVPPGLGMGGESPGTGAWAVEVSLDATAGGGKLSHITCQGVSEGLEEDFRSISHTSSLLQHTTMRKHPLFNALKSMYAHTAIFTGFGIDR